MPKHCLTLLILFILTVFLEQLTESLAVAFPRNFYHLPRRFLKGSNPGVFRLIKGARGSFYTETSVHSKEGEFLINMMISLSTSETLLAQGCLGFLRFPCEKFGCQEYLQNKINTSLPYFQAQGHQASVKMYLDLLWQLQDKCIRSVSCFGSPIYYGDGVYGVIGLGVAGGGRFNFQDRNLKFSIYMNQDRTQAELWKGKNEERSQSSPFAIVKSTENWWIRGVEGLQIRNISIDFDHNKTKVIIDPNRDTLGLPIHILRGLFRILEKEKNPIKCSQNVQNLYRPKCAFYGNPHDLPNLILYVQGQVLPIILSDYVESYDRNQGWIILKLSSLNHNVRIPETYVTEDSLDTIILDQHFMAQNYIVFTYNVSSSSPTIEFSQAKHEKFYGNSHNITFILVLAFGTIGCILIGVGFLASKVWKDVRRPHNLPVWHYLLHHNQKKFQEIQDPQGRQDLETEHIHHRYCGLDEWEGSGLNEQISFKVVSYQNNQFD